MGLFRRFKKQQDKQKSEKRGSAPASSGRTASPRFEKPAPAPVSAPSPYISPSTTTAKDLRLSSPASSGRSGNRPSWLCRTKYFQRMCDQAFTTIDTDGSGSVDEKELYSGLLLIHLKLGLYAGPAACRPIGRERCSAVFEKMDFDNSGSLDKEEFREVMMVLFSNVVLRVLAQWSLTLLIVPLVAHKVLELVYLAIHTLYYIVTNMDEYSSIADKIELTIEAAADWFVKSLPESVLMVWDEFVSLLDLVPDSVWNTIPLTLISTILGILVVPWVIFKIDDGFQYLADKKVKSV